MARNLTVILFYFLTINYSMSRAFRFSLILLSVLSSSYDRHFGFRKNHSTSHALNVSIDHILKQQSVMKTMSLEFLSI